MISFLTPLATDGISFTYGYVFVGTNIAAALLTWFFLYESVSLSLENVDLMYGQPDLKPWTSRKWMPPGYVTRLKRDDDFFRRRASAAAGKGTDDMDDRTTAVPSGRPSRAVDDGGMEKKGSNDLAFRGGEERVERAV